jgi:uncharacterized protein YndB with AHSA1/START domain
MLRKIGIGLGVLLLALAAGIATRPNSYRVERSATIAAPPDVVFGYVNDFHQWTQWSPFEKLDPDMKRTFDGAPSGVGSVYSWAGNRQAGAGTMTIKESAPNQRIALDLHFLKPFESAAATEFTFKPVAEGVTVTWTMSGDNTILGKAISIFASMDTLVGGQFESGLATLKAVAEAEARRRGTGA